MPLCALVTVKSFVATFVTFNISSSINIKSLVAMPVPLVTVSVVSESLYVPPSFIVVDYAPLVVPPHCPALHPVPPTVLSNPVFT